MEQKEHEIETIRENHQELDTPQLPRDSCSLIQMNVKFPTLSRDSNPMEEAAMLEDENVEFDSSKLITHNSSPCNIKASQRKSKCQVQSMNLFYKGNELFSHRNAYYIKAKEDLPPFEKNDDIKHNEQE